MSNRLIRIKDVMDRTGLARSTVYKYINLGQFPQPIKLGTRAVAWVEREVEAWICESIERRDQVVLK
ncbi:MULTISPECIES: AlpA family transcriptional regulator [Halomonadaceae]|jgi:prophage regulatory protein|uniref:AlpA family transcriptional regulator n=2 Tax=Vreelandella TaxID=3137766 RepID=A0A857GQI6_9GAMM|nr:MULTISPECIES: AlpA family transcriptional regulator [Halomonas]PTB98455.1 AlpA family transcriptional regulator [Marinobacter sp. Z-F4-2]KAE8437816.1 AlpA family transcriptional regulator [Halomonas piezotolerans]MCD6438344.1 AlpA family transcriptional regulator [Halomonas sp.]MCG7591707.1 AlpA family transcriptional regulator [Halomonas sp. McD50-5]MCG7617719.1 AlpA family transcriptional regulator [Halomonas sp. McD50-4]|tara:strand:- start:96 stop:296 length:201 start_codon:yes stop_codon:yes gene_type:complete